MANDNNEKPREYPRYVHSVDRPGLTAYVESQEDEDKLKGKWQDLPWHEERDGETEEEEVLAKRPRGRPPVQRDDKKKELDQKTAHDIDKILPMADDLAGSGYTDQDDAPEDAKGE